MVENNKTQTEDDIVLSMFSIVGGLLTIVLILCIVILILLHIQFVVIFCVGISGVLNIALYFGIGSCVKKNQLLEIEIEKLKKSQNK